MIWHSHLLPSKGRRQPVIFFFFFFFDEERVCKIERRDCQRRDSLWIIWKSKKKKMVPTDWVLIWRRNKKARAGSSAWRHINYLVVVVCPLGFLFIFGVCVTRQCLYGKGVDPLTIDLTIQLCTRLSAGPKKVPQTTKHKTKKREEEERYSADDEGVPKFIRFTKKKLRQKKRKTKFYAFDLFFLMMMMKRRRR